MPYTTLIQVSDLHQALDSSAPFMVFDCSFDLAQPQAGVAHYATAHIPGAVYASLDKHLSAHDGDTPASGGRHPLPSRERFTAWLASVGFTNDMQAVVYDRNGANYCGRLWWMLRWVGHDAVAVLDGGLQAWEASGFPTESGPGTPRAPAAFTPHASLQRLVNAHDVASQLSTPTQTVIDARAPARYRGETEPLDPVAGHIPGALNRPFSTNLGTDGRFKPATQLREEFHALLQGRAPESVVHQCGSGVSALPNLLAMEIAGLGPTALYAGSWSDWCSDASRPVERG